MSTVKVGRVYFLDTFRFVAVTFALLAHVSEHHGLDGLGSDAGVLWTSLTRTAVPSLLIVFGVMLEIVYARRFADQPAIVVSRMLHRAALCYVAFVASALIALVAGWKDLGGFVGSVVLLSSVPYTVIFELYAFLLVFGIGMVALRVRYGMAGLLGIVGSVWLADATYIDGLGPWPDPFRHIGGLLFGLGRSFGPSVLHGSTLVVFGMVLGNVAFSPRPSRFAGATLAFLLLAAAAIVSREVWGNSLWNLLVGIADIRVFRTDNHVVYFAYGTWAAMALLAFSYVLHLASPAWLRRLGGTLGSATFAYFFIGNAILLAMPGFRVDGTLAVVALFAAYLLTFCGATLLWLSRARDVVPLARAAAWGQARAKAWMTGMAGRPPGAARGSEGGGQRG